MNDYQRIARMIRYLDQRHAEQPDLAELAAYAGLSPYHFHRLFSRWAGVTPKDFLQCLTLTHAQQMLCGGESVLQTALATGLSGPARLHDLCVSLEAASPGELKAGGTGWIIQAGCGESPFGTCLVGESPRGICHLAFVPEPNRNMTGKSIEMSWPRAEIRWDDSRAQGLIDTLFQNPSDAPIRPSLRAYVRGSNFQLRVWRALLLVPAGQLVSYGQIAQALGNRAAARAVGTAVAQNPLAYLIPCHRVIRETGVLGNYRWGATRKKAMVAWEGELGTVHTGHDDRHDN